MNAAGGAYLASLSLLIGGQAVSALGNEFHHVALPVLVTGRHGPSVLGTVLSAYGALRLAGLLAGGRLADRFGPAAVMIWSDLVRVAGVALLLTAVWGGPGGLPLLYLAAALVGLGEGVYLPGSFAILPLVVPPGRLAAANAANFGAVQAMALFGPVLAAVVVAGAGPGAAFGADAATFAASVATLLLVRRRTPARPARTGAPASVRPVLRANPAIRALVAMAVVGSLGFVAAVSVGLPALLLPGAAGGAVRYGTVLSAFALGALAGSAAAARLPRGARPGRTVCVLLLAEAALLAAVPHGGTAWVCCCLLGVGAANALTNVLVTTALQRDVPGEVLGRVMSLLLAAAFGLFPVATAAAGWVARTAGTPAVFRLGAGALALAAAAGAASRDLRLLGRPARTPPAAQRAPAAEPTTTRKEVTT